MRNFSNTWIYVLIVFCAICTTSCENEEKVINESEPDLSRIRFIIGSVSNITSNSATISGSIFLDGQDVNLGSHGVCYSAENNPPKLPDDLYTGNTSSDIENMVMNLENLSPNTTYYCRVYGMMDIGLAYSTNTVKFTTLDINSGTVDPEERYSTVEDIDGNVYKTIKIGNQWWMAENLKVKHYRNGEAITFIEEGCYNNWDNPWGRVKSGAYCYNMVDSVLTDTFGLLYNWYAAVDSRNIAPEGWHVPSDEEWRAFLHEIGYDWTRDYITARKLMSTEHWRGNVGSNSLEFNVYPSGWREVDGCYLDRHDSPLERCSFWASTYYSNTSADILLIGRCTNCYDNNPYVKLTIESKAGGFSIRCIKD